METIHDRIRRKREEKGWPQAELARRVGVSTQAVQQWESKDPDTRTAPRRAAKLKVAAELGVTPLWLDYGDDLPSYLLEAQTPDAAPRVRELQVPFAPKPRLLPIIGFAIATPDEDGYFDDMGYAPNAAMEYVLTWHSDDPSAYGLRVKKDSMSPRIRSGEIIVIEPSAQVSSGDDVLVKLRNGRKMVKRLLYQRGGEVGLHSVNVAHQELTISLEEVEAIQLVAAILPRGTKTKEGA